MSDSVSTVSTMPPLPEGVREGGEQLVRLTPEAGAKVAALIAREQAGNFLAWRSPAAAATASATS